MTSIKNVYRKGNTLYYARQVDGKRKFINLCPANSPDHEVMRRVAEIIRAQTEDDSLNSVFDSYLKNALTELALSSQEDYRNIINNTLRLVFGEQRPDNVHAKQIAQYLEKRKDQGRGSRANKEIAVLASVFEHGLRKGYCSHNPTRAVRRNKVRARTYYITDESLRQALKHADASLRHIMWAAYLTGFRQRDLRELRRENLTPDGIKVIQSKDGKHEIRLWSDSLRKVVRRALDRSRGEYVFTNTKGQKFSLSAIQSAMRRLKAKCPEIDWRFHDIRAKAESDHETGLGLMRRYQRATKRRAVR